MDIEYSSEEFKKYIEFPLYCDAYGLYVYSGYYQNNITVCMDIPIYTSRTKEQAASNKIMLKEIVNYLNEEKYDTSLLPLSVKYDQKEQIISDGNGFNLRIRGWGRLSKLGHKKAIDIQDSFASWIVSKLNNR